ncbi:MAG: hypothetical protein AB7E04_08670 [Desulfobacteraceae bacterium]
MKKFKLSLVLLIFLLFFTACKTTNFFAPGVFGPRKPPTIETCKNESIITYIFPENLNILKDKYKSLYEYKEGNDYSLNFPELYSRYNCSSGLGNLCSTLGIKTTILAKDLILVQKYNGMSSRSTPDNSVTYEIKKEVLFEKNQLMLKYTPLRCIKDYQTKDLQFTLEDLQSYLKKPNNLFPVIVEFDSTFSVDSIQGNFERILGPQKTITLKDAEVKLEIDIFPYKNGSKTVVSFNIPTVITSGNIVNLEKNFNEIKTILYNIVNS